MHKDSGPVKPDDPYYTVLFVLNKEWQPDWGGELTFFNDEETGAKHWKRGYNLGWPEKIVGYLLLGYMCYIIVCMILGTFDII